jgi:Ca2+-binding RTX toxin-like protein
MVVPAGDKRMMAAAWLFMGLVALLACLLPASAGAVGPSCDGAAATIVSNQRQIVGSEGHDVIVGGPGTNSIVGLGGNDRICGGGGGDSIRGGRGSDDLYGQGGADTISGERGGDGLAGGPDDDELHGDRGSDQLDGGLGTDHLFGDTGNDTLTGGEGDHDYVDGGPGDEPLVAGGGGDFDVTAGGPGVDAIDGGPGKHDIASYTSSSGSLEVDLVGGTMVGPESEQLVEVEDVIGGIGADVLIGSDEPNRLDGGPGDDQLQSVAAGDQAFGGPGSNDCSSNFALENACGTTAVTGGVAVQLTASNDGASSLVIAGTEAADDVTVARSGRTYVVSGLAGTRVVPGAPQEPGCVADAGSVVCSGSPDKILASTGDGDDVLTLSGTSPDVSAVLDGGRGSDDLTGSAGNDVLYGGEDASPDTLHGADGDDVLFGVNPAHPRRSSGSAALYGDGGADLLVGGQPCEGDVFNGGGG